MSPDEMREAVLADLEPLSCQKGVKSLMQKLSCGSSGESMVLINACKCIHVVKNWCFEARCIQAQFVVRFLEINLFFQAMLIYAMSCYIFVSSALRSQILGNNCSDSFES